MNYEIDDRSQWPYAGLLPHSVKIYPVVQVAPEVGSQSTREWPRPMLENTRAWRDKHAWYPNAGNQIYLHVPFCPFICHFCPLFKMKLGKNEEVDVKKAFVKAMIEEIELYGRSRTLAG